MEQITIGASMYAIWLAIKIYWEFGSGVDSYLMECRIPIRKNQTDEKNLKRSYITFPPFILPSGRQKMTHGKRSMTIRTKRA
jgi:hypothetical protein